MDNTHEWCADGVEPEIEHLQDIDLDKELPWFARRIRNGEVCHVPDVTALPPEARLERAHFEAQGIQSLIVLPVAAEEHLLGFIGFDAVRERRSWSADEQYMLHLVGECFAHVIARKRMEEALRASEEKLREEKEFSKAIIDANHTIIVGLDKQHTIRVFSKGAERITGYSRAEVLGKDWCALFLPFENQEKIDAIWKSVWEQDYEAFVLSLGNRDRQDVPWDASQHTPHDWRSRFHH